MTVTYHFPFHPAYGLPDDYRSRVLDDADEMGVKAAAEKHHLSDSCIYKWRKARETGENPYRRDA